jgi:predicted site-specific integrase-resolvase
MAHPDTSRRTPDGSTVLEDYVPEDDLARDLGITRRTLRMWRARGEAPPITRLGLRILYHRDDIREWLRSRRGRAA